MAAKPQAAEHANEVRSGEWVRAADATQAYGAMIAVARVKLLALGNKIAARAKMCATIAEVAALIDREVTTILDELSQPQAYGLDAVDAAE
jgi:hypothetical protein